MGGELAHAREVHALVKWAVTERSRAICRGWSRVPASWVQQHLVALQQWLVRYQPPSPATQRMFLHEYWHHVQAVMPGTPAGRKKLARLRELLEKA